ncbi:MAG: NAD-dependent epimerase/dehydratase [Phycisphaerales bacterium]|nr:NAD-dependent epimerase/dehydratase [Phycisphaerales bacterium]
MTGATGFVGSHTAAHFLSNGWRVKALVRRPGVPSLLPAGAEVVRGDVLDAASYRTALDGCDAVVHAAGLVKARTRDEYIAVNAGGAAAVARAAAEACPRAMFVLVSSQAAAGPARDGVPVRESDPPRPVSWYGESKLAGEREVERHVRGPWCSVRPSAVHGRGDPGVLELFKPVQLGIAPILAGGRARVHLIGVGDLARVLVAAAARPDLSGRRGFAAGDVVSLRELMTFLATDLRRKPAWRVPVPAAAVRAAGLWESLRQAVTRRARPFNRDKARELLQPDWLCDAKPFLGDLGVVDLGGWREQVRDTCRCYVEAGWLRRDVWAV